MPGGGPICILGRATRTGGKSCHGERRDDGSAKASAQAVRAAVRLPEASRSRAPDAALHLQLTYDLVDRSIPGFP